MNIFLNRYVIVFFAVTAVSSFVHASERTLSANVDAGVVYNDNIFLSDDPESVTGLIVTPSLSGVIKEQNWQARLEARLRINEYSNESLDSDEQLFSLGGRYLAERNIFGINATHVLFSNLNTVSSDFGLTQEQVLRKTQTLSPRYTRLLTERSSLNLSLAYTDVSFSEFSRSSFTPYIQQVGSGSWRYKLTERNNISLGLVVTDYESKDKLVTYLSYVTRFGLTHEVSQTLVANFSVGVSRRDSTNLQTERLDFFGNPAVLAQEIDSKNRGLVYNASITKKLESGQFGGQISRNESSNSFGGLDEVNSIRLNYSKSLSSLLSYSLRANFVRVETISSSSATTDRDVFVFNSRISYRLAQNWSVNVSYSYSQRRFKSDVSEDRAPLSNSITAGLTYNFPSLTTF